jgi:hypothetical protein
VGKIISLPKIFLIEGTISVCVASIDTMFFLQLQSSDISKDKQADQALADTLKVISHSCSPLALSHHIIVFSVFVSCHIEVIGSINTFTCF